VCFSACVKVQPLAIKQRIKLRDFDPAYDGGVDKDKAKKKTHEYAERISELQELLYANSRHAVLLVFQGMDASGKDGAVRSVLEQVNPVGVQTANFKVPSEEERAHDFLWRIHKAVPRYGHIGVFNRSHYEAVLAERVLKIVPKVIWSKRYAQIVNYEQILVENNIVLLKFYLHISKKEQAERFADRVAQPHKRWKFSLSDLKTRQQWDAYMQAYEDMINATSHPRARWHIVPANRNWLRDFLIAKTVVRAMEALKMKWPEPGGDLSKVKII
jgi:PPK2 family polyphosphate:nucleotide phosphotransferase